MNATTKTNTRTHITVGVLGGAYRNQRVLDNPKSLLTHLVAVEPYGEEGYDYIKTCGGVKIDNLADSCSADETALDARPTCAVCGRRWDKLQASK